MNNNPLYKYYLWMLGAITTLPVLAPILLKLSESYQVFLWPARAIYFLYSFSCHQFHHRSIHIFDYQYAWCARDTGIWLAIFVTALMVKKYRLKMIPLYWAIPFIVPIALDGGIQTIATVMGIESAFGVTGGGILYVSNNLIRFITGTIFGIGLSLVLSPMVADLGKKAVGFNKQIVYKFSLLFLALMIVYAGSVQIWNLTSTVNKPSDFLDTAVKTPAKSLFARRQNGACPSQTENLLDFNCSST